MTVVNVVAEQIEQGEQQQDTHARNLRALTNRVEAIRDAKVDAVADTRALEAFAIPAGDNHPAQALIRIPNGMVMQIGDVAHQQLAQRLNIDKRYYDRMVGEAPALLVDNLNYWFRNKPEERLLRMLRPAAYSPDDQRQMQGVGAQLRLRGVLGKGYRTIDDAELVAAIVPTLVERGALLSEFSIDERRMHAKFFTVAQDVQTIRARYAEQAGITVAELVARRGHVMVDGKDIAFVNEVLSAGVVIRHSEVGFASLGASFVTRILKCLNDYVADNAIAIRHVGGRQGIADEDVRFLSDATQLMDNAALLGRVQDSIAGEFEPARLYERAEALALAKVEPLNRPKDRPLFEFVGNIGLSLGLTTEQTEVLKEETQRAIIEEQGETKFAFVQGITAVARQMTDYDRRLDVERSGFQFLNDSPAALLKLGRDAEQNARKRKN